MTQHLVGPRRNWRIDPVGEPAFEVLFTPPLTRDKVVAWYPDAVCTPFEPTLAPPPPHPDQVQWLRTAIGRLLPDATREEREEALRVAVLDKDAARECFATLLKEPT